MLSRDDFRNMAAGKFVYMSEGVIDYKQLTVFVEGALWALDFAVATKVSDRTEQAIETIPNTIAHQQPKMSGLQSV